MKSMMWMMVICCALPLLLVFVFGLGGGKAVGAPSWLIWGGIGVMVLAHFFMMGKSHTSRRPSDEEKTNISEEGKDEKEKDSSGHGCCH